MEQQEQVRIDIINQCKDNMRVYQKQVDDLSKKDYLDELHQEILEYSQIQVAFLTNIISHVEKINVK